MFLQIIKYDIQNHSIDFMIFLIKRQNNNTICGFSFTFFIFFNIVLHKRNKVRKEEMSHSKEKGLKTYKTKEIDDTYLASNEYLFKRFRSHQKFWAPVR